MKLEDLLLLGAAVGAGYLIAKRYGAKTPKLSSGQSAVEVASQTLTMAPQAVTTPVLARVADPFVVVDDDPYPYPYGYAYPVYYGGWFGPRRHHGGGGHGGHHRGGR